MKERPQRMALLHENGFRRSDEFAGANLLPGAITEVHVADDRG
jgi:hypothetical protein